jgi:hypothetical protein
VKANKNKSRHLLCGRVKLENYKIIKNVKFYARHMLRYVHTLLNVCICFQIGGWVDECILWLSFAQQKLGVLLFTTEWHMQASFV